MMWLLFVGIATILDAIRIFIDNYSSDVYFKGRSAVSQKVVYGYMFLVSALILCIVTGFSFNADHVFQYSIFIVSGLLSGIAGIPYYKALELDDSTNIGIFTQLAPVIYLILGWFILDETFVPIQLLAFAVIMLAPLLIVVTTKKRSRKIKVKAVIYAFLYVLIATIGNIIYVKESLPEINYFTSMIFVFIGKGISDLIIFYSHPKWRRRFRQVMKTSRKKVLRPILTNSVVGFVKDLTYRYGLIVAPSIALASAASDSVEPIVIFFLGIVLTLIWPKFGREKLDKKSVFVHLVATALVVIGIILHQIQ